MRRCNLRFGTLCVIFGIAAFGIVLVVVTWLVSAEYHRSLLEARDANARGRLAQLQLCIDNYKSIHGRALHRIYSDRQGKRMSWREEIAPYFDDELMRAKALNPDRNDDLRKAHADQIAPVSFRVSFDASNAYFTSIVAVYDEANEENDDAPWAIAAMSNTGIRWNEPKDLTISEFLKLLDSSQAANQTIAVLTASGQLGSIVDGSSLRFFLHSPGQPAIDRFLLNDKK